MIQHLSAEYPVRYLCQMLDCPTSSYYYQPQRQEDDPELVKAIEQQLALRPYLVLVQCQMDTGHKKQVTIGGAQYPANIAGVVYALVPISGGVGQKSRLHVDAVCPQV